MFRALGPTWIDSYENVAVIELSVAFVQAATNAMANFSSMKPTQVWKLLLNDSDILRPNTIEKTKQF